MSDNTAPRRLSRAAGDGPPPAPVRIVHLGLGNFFRAHQAYYTMRANESVDPEDRWGIAAFTGRSFGVAADLIPQDGLYTLVLKGSDGDTNVVIPTLSDVHAADDLATWRRYLASAQTAVVTSTVTEAGYCRNDSGGLATDDPGVAADVAALRTDPVDGVVTTAPGKIVAGLLARRGAGAGPISLVPCDNVPDNGEMAERVTREFADLVDPSLREWIDANVTFVTTMVDRITPRATEADRKTLTEQTGVDDPGLVVTEPFTEWVLCGRFAGPRPRWEAAGARFVDDIRPWEMRKLWLLNGSHSLMAYAATILGHDTVYQAIMDPTVRGWVEEWWDVAGRHLPLPEEEVMAYRRALIDRYSNVNIRHLLSQIAADGSQKVAIRHVPALRADLASGRMPYGATRAVAAWVQHLRGHGAPVVDAHRDEVLALVSDSLEGSVDNVLRYLGIDNAEVGEVVVRQARELVP